MLVYQDKRGVLKDSNRYSKIRKDATILPALDKGIYNSKVEVYYLKLGNGINTTKEDFARVELVIGRRQISGVPVKKGILESRTTLALNRD